MDVSTETEDRPWCIRDREEVEAEKEQPGRVGGKQDQLAQERDSRKEAVENNRAVLEKSSMEFPYDSAMSFLGIYPKELQAGV